MADLINERDSALKELDDCIDERDIVVKQAIGEGAYYVRKVDSYKHKSTEQASQITSLTKYTVAAEFWQQKAEKQVHQSTRGSQSAMQYTECLLEKIKELEGTMQDLQNCNTDLQLQLDEKDEQLKLTDGASPIRVFSEVRYRRGGQ